MSISHRMCQQHLIGRDWDEPAYFNRWCRKCQELLAVGKRTGKEPPGPRGELWNRMETARIAEVMALAKNRRKKAA